MTTSAATIRFILFDAVGTLIRVQPSVVEIYLSVGSRFGTRLNRQELRERFARSLMAQQDSNATDEERERRRWRTIVAEVLHDIPHAGDRPFEDLWDAFARPEHWSLFSDVPEAWQELRRRGLSVGIASNFDRRLQGIRQSFPPLDTAAYCFISSQVGFPKPHPEFFRRVERELDATPAEILLVGDSLVHDVEGARSAGWHAVHLDRSTNATGDQTICSLTGLLDFL